MENNLILLEVIKLIKLKAHYLNLEQLTHLIPPLN